MLVYDLDVEHVDESRDDTWEVADRDVPSADDPSTVSELDVTTKEEALHKHLWQEVVAGSVLGAKQSLLTPFGNLRWFHSA